MKKRWLIAAAVSPALFASPGLAQPASLYAFNPNVVVRNDPQTLPGHPWDTNQRGFWAPRDLYGGGHRRGDSALSVPQRHIAALIDNGAFNDAAVAARELAGAGDLWATRQLGWLFLRGLGVPRAPDTALQLLRAAAEGGDAPSALALGSLYLQGVEGIGRDPELAGTWLTRAESGGDLAVRREARRLRRGL